MSFPPITRAISKRQSTAEGPLISDPPAPSDGDDDSESSENPASEDKVDATPRINKRKARDSSSDIDEDDDDDLLNGEFISSTDEPTLPRRNKGKEREHTPDDKPDSAESGHSNDDTEDEDSEGGRSDKEAGSKQNAEPEDDSKSIYHWQIWDRLVRLASNNGGNSYVHEPKRGGDPRDVTAYLASQASWGEDRAHRPPILSVWIPPLPRSSPTYTVGVLSYNKHVVQDWEGKAIRAFRNLPLTISSAVRGFRIEAWLRTDNRMTYRDVVARMWTQERPTGREPIYRDRTLASRCIHFRENAGCVSWAFVRTQEVSRNFMDSLRTPAQRANNRTTDRDLTSAQKAAYHALTRTISTSRSAPAEGTTDPSIPSRSAHTAKRSTTSLERSAQSAPIADISSAQGLNAPPSSTAAGGASIAGSATDEEEDDLFDEMTGQDRRYPIPQVPTDAIEQFNDNESVSSAFLEDPTDSRNNRPASAEEVNALQMALNLTVADFYELTGGQEPAQSPPEEDYFAQWNSYQRQFEIFWAQLGNTDRAPILIGLDRWFDGICNWETARLASSERDFMEEQFFE